MYRWMKAITIAGLIGLGLAACDDAPGHNGVVTVAHLFEDGAAYQDHTVTVRGYLALWADLILMVEDKAAVEEWNSEALPEPDIGVWDSSVGSPGLSHQGHQHPCLFNYAQITGRYIHRSGYTARLIYEVDEIRVWPDGEFEGRGILCFHRKQDGKHLDMGPDLLWDRKTDKDHFDAYVKRFEIRRLAEPYQIIKPAMPGDYERPSAHSVAETIRSAVADTVEIRTVRGYLQRTLMEKYRTPTADLYLFPDAASATEDTALVLRRQDVVRVLDSSRYQDLLFDWVEYKAGSECKKHYVEITGGFIKTALGYPYVIYDVHEVRTFDDATYAGEGNVCYRKSEKAGEYFPLVPGLY